MRSQMRLCSVNNHLQNNWSKILSSEIFSGFILSFVIPLGCYFWCPLCIILPFLIFLSVVVKVFSFPYSSFILLHFKENELSLNSSMLLEYLYNRKTIYFFCNIVLYLYLGDFWPHVLSSVLFWNYPKFDSLVWRQLNFLFSF